MIKFNIGKIVQKGCTDFILFKSKKQMIKQLSKYIEDWKI
jgi:hypothetical protein